MTELRHERFTKPRTRHTMKRFIRRNRNNPEGHQWELIEDHNLQIVVASYSTLDEAEAAAAARHTDPRDEQIAELREVLYQVYSELQRYAPGSKGIDRARELLTAEP